MQAVVSKTFVWNLLAAINSLPRNDFWKSIVGISKCIHVGGYEVDSQIKE